MITPSSRSSPVNPLTFVQGGHIRILPPRDVRSLIISPTVGSSGFRCTLSAAPLRTRSTAELVRNKVTSSPVLIAPLEMLQATDIFSSSSPQAITTTNCFFFSGIATSVLVNSSLNSNQTVIRIADDRHAFPVRCSTMLVY